MPWGSGAATHWRVYRGLDTQFSTTYASWRYPPTPSDFGERCGEYMTLDLNGDGSVDLVCTEDERNDVPWGIASNNAHFRVYFGVR